MGAINEMFKELDGPATLDKFVQTGTVYLHLPSGQGHITIVPCQDILNELGFHLPPGFFCRCLAALEKIRMITKGSFRQMVSPP